MSQFFNDHEIQNPGSQLINCGPKKNLKEKKNYEIFKKCCFREKDSETLTNVNKQLKPREDKGDRKGIPHRHLIPQVIRLELFLRPQIPKEIRQQPITQREFVKLISRVVKESSDSLFPGERRLISLQYSEMLSISLRFHCLSPDMFCTAFSHAKPPDLRNIHAAREVILFRF